MFPSVAQQSKEISTRDVANRAAMDREVSRADVTRAEGPKDSPDGLNYASARIEQAVCAQSEVLHKLYAVLADNGLLRPEPAAAGNAGNSDRPVQPRLASRLLDAARMIDQNREGLAYILSRLDL